jgi:putative multiple sugar transport system ATP-binding protein
MTPILEMRHITKTFPGVKALSDVNIEVWPSEIHALVGENGAGKSTLMKVLSGVYPHGSYEGDIVYQGETRHFSSIADSEKLGIIIIHQELALVPLLSIAENIFLGSEPGRYGIVDHFEAARRTKELLAKVGLKEHPSRLIGDLGVGKQQLIEIAKALSKKVNLLILDEPTASLNEADSNALLELLLEFKAQGIASILISHKLNEISRVADRITILRDGTTVETIDCTNERADEDRIIRGMVGREITDRYPKRDTPVGEVMFEVEGWTADDPVTTGRRICKNVGITVRKGEVVGIAGLMGAGRTEFAMSLFGRSYGRWVSGKARLEGEEIDVSSVSHAVAAGIAYATEDRKQYGLVLGQDIRENNVMANMKGVSRHGVIDDVATIGVAEGYRKSMRIRCRNIFQETLDLSGGNQQKVVLAKWLFADPKILILDEPTRGIDVGAKYEIYGIINRLVADGRGVIIISSEMPELLGVADRIYVMDEGAIVAEMPAAEASQEKIMRAIMSSRELAR